MIISRRFLQSFRRKDVKNTICEKYKFEEHIENDFMKNILVGKLAFCMADVFRYNLNILRRPPNFAKYPL